MAHGNLRPRWRTQGLSTVSWSLWAAVGFPGRHTPETEGTPRPEARRLRSPPGPGAGWSVWHSHVRAACEPPPLEQVVRGQEKRVSGEGTTHLRRRLEGGELAETFLPAGSAAGATGGDRRVWGGVVAAARLLHRGALGREMPLQPRGKDLGFRILAQAFRLVLANECQQLGLVLPPAIVLMLAGMIQCI